MQNKHGLLVKDIIMQIIRQVLIVLMGGLTMSQIVAASSEFRLFEKIACDSLSYDKHLFSGFTIRLSLRRSLNDIIIMSEHQLKSYQFQIRETNLYVGRMAVTYFLLSSIEKTLLKTPAIYKYIKVLPRIFWPQQVYEAGDKKMFLPKSQFLE